MDQATLQKLLKRKAELEERSATVRARLSQQKEEKARVVALLKEMGVDVDLDDRKAVERLLVNELTKAKASLDDIDERSKKVSDLLAGMSR